MDTVQLKKLIEDGNSIQQTAKILNASHSGVRYWVWKLGLQPNYVYTSKYPDDAIALAVSQSKSYNDVLNKLGINHAGGIYYHIKNKIITLGLDTSHFEKNNSHWQHICQNSNGKKPADQILTKGKIRRENACRLRRALKEIGREYKCEMCGQGTIWNGKKLTLAVDHIDGDWTDCRASNLRFLCPNCHTQTPTYCGRKGKKIPICSECGDIINKGYTRCKKCDGNDPNRNIHLRKCERPPYQQLLQEVSDLGYVGVGKKYGVSDKAIVKWIKHYEKTGE